MTGAGTGTLVAAGEQDFMGSLVDDDTDGTPDLFHLGRNPTISELSLSNELEEMREGDEAWSVESVKQNFEGAIAVEAAVSEDVHTDIEEQLVLNATDTVVPGVSTSGRIFAGVNYPSGQATEEYLGCIPLSYDVSYEQGGNVTYSLSMAYADQKPDPSTDLTTATEVTDGSTVGFHDFDLSIDGTTVADMQSATLSLSELSRFQRGGSPTPNRGVTAAPSASLDVEAIFTSPSRLDLARGSSTSAPPDRLDSVPGTITINAPSGGALRTFELDNLKPDTHNWNEILGTEDTTDSTTFNVTGRPAVTFA
jgi:hypothetical protein